MNSRSLVMAGSKPFARFQISRKMASVNASASASPVSHLRAIDQTKPPYFSRHWATAVLLLTAIWVSTGVVTVSFVRLAEFNIINKVDKPKIYTRREVVSVLAVTFRLY